VTPVSETSQTPACWDPSFLHTFLAFLRSLPFLNCFPPLLSVLTYLIPAVLSEWNRTTPTWLICCGFSYCDNLFRLICCGFSYCDNLCRDYNCNSTMIRLQSDCDVLLAPASNSTQAKNERQFFVIVVSQSNRTHIVILITSIVVECVVVSLYRSRITIAI